MKLLRPPTLAIEEADVPFPHRVPGDIRGPCRIAGSSYIPSIQELLDYCRQSFPELIGNTLAHANHGSQIMIRSEIQALLRLGRFPASAAVDIHNIRLQQQLLEKVKPPVSDEEARYLLGLFGPDDYFGLAWTVLHLIESALSWPISECLSDLSNEWIVRLKDSARRAGKL
jgi:hypothetical protein